MNKTYYLIFILFLTKITTITCQELAITENNDTVYLYPNGTWSYEFSYESPLLENEYSFLDEELKFDTIENKLSFSEEAKSSLNNRFGLYELKYNPNNWKRTPPAQFNEEAEFSLVHREKEIYCISISEEIGVGFENLPKIAMQTIEANTGATVNVKKNEIRNVNGTKVIRSVFDLELSGMKLTFDSYYYSSDKGTVQLSTWTGSNLWSKYEADIISLLNGLVINK